MCVCVWVCYCAIDYFKVAKTRKMQQGWFETRACFWLFRLIGEEGCVLTELCLYALFGRRITRRIWTDDTFLSQDKINANVDEQQMFERSLTIN